MRNFGVHVYAFSKSIYTTYRFLIRILHLIRMSHILGNPIAKLCLKHLFKNVQERNDSLVKIVYDIIN